MRENPPYPTDDNQFGSKQVEPIDPDRPIPTARGILSAAEIEALLRPELSDLPSETAAKDISDRPLPALATASEQAENRRKVEAGQLAARLSLTLGQHCGVKAAIRLQDCLVQDALLEADFTFGPGAALCFGTRDDTVEAMVYLPSVLADAIIAKACGAPPTIMDTGRTGQSWTLSAIDCALLEQLLPPLGLAVRSDLRLIAIETDTAYVISLLPTKTLTQMRFSVEAPRLSSSIMVIQCQSDEQTAQRPQIERQKLPVTALLTARLASLNVPLSRVTSLTAGSTLLLGLPTDQPVEILSGDRDGPVVMEGSVGRKGNKIAVKVTGINRSILKDNAP